MSDEDPVIQTNLDAALSKRDAVTKGYWHDPYIQYFVKTTERKTPEISRGYYARVQGIKMILDKFLKVCGPECQVVNLGAGFDTLFWRLMDEKAQFKSLVEVDLPAVTTRKCYYIRLRKQLLKGIATEDDDVRVSASDLHAGHYHLVGCDLRELDVFEAKVVHESGLDLNLPTMFIAECVLVYMSCDESSALLSWITRNFQNAVLVSYDPVSVVPCSSNEEESKWFGDHNVMVLPVDLGNTRGLNEKVNMGDKFAEVMVENLKQRNCLLAGLQACTTIKAQEERIRLSGWEVCKVWTMNQVYQSFPALELHRVEKLEMLDERELLDQLLSHYCLCIAYKGGGVPSKFERLCFPLDSH